MNFETTKGNMLPPPPLHTSSSTSSTSAQKEQTHVAPAVKRVTNFADNYRIRKVGDVFNVYYLGEDGQQKERLLCEKSSWRKAEAYIRQLSEKAGCDLIGESRLVGLKRTGRIAESMLRNEGSSIPVTT